MGIIGAILDDPNLTDEEKHSRLSHLAKESRAAVRERNFERNAYIVYYRASGVTIKELAEQFHLHRNTVGRIIRDHTDRLLTIWEVLREKAKPLAHIVKNLVWRMHHEPSFHRGGVGRGVESMRGDIPKPTLITPKREVRAVPLCRFHDKESFRERLMRYGIQRLRRPEGYTEPRASTDCDWDCPEHPIRRAGRRLWEKGAAFWDKLAVSQMKVS